MERSIPHIRSIFSNTSSRRKSDTQDLCQYDASPRSRRKPKDPPVDYFDAAQKKNPLFDLHHKSKENSPKKNLLEHKSKEFSPMKNLLDYKSKENSPMKNLLEHKSKEEPQYKKSFFDYRSKEDSPRKSDKQNHNQEPSRSKSRGSYNCNTYTSKNLTERDMRHLERHLSMKKTIRKQISRNLAQAFLENPDVFEPEATDTSTPLKSRGGDYQKLISCEQNVLDLLKVSIEDRDSGHSSPTHETLEDTDEDEEEAGWPAGRRSGRKASETRGLVGDPRTKDAEKKSIWSMFRKERR